jgi:hypothetical protein
MKLSPVRAGCVFGIAHALPAVPFAVLHGARDWRIVALIVAFCVWFGIAFALGAIAAGRPHSVKSILLAVGAIWSFTSSTNWLAEHNLEGVPWFPWPATLMAAIQSLFVLLAGWRFAPPVIEPDRFRETPLSGPEG